MQFWFIWFTIYFPFYVIVFPFASFEKNLRRILQWLVFSWGEPSIDASAPTPVNCWSRPYGSISVGKFIITISLNHTINAISFIIFSWKFINNIVSSSKLVTYPSEYLPLGIYFWLHNLCFSLKISSCLVQYILHQTGWVISSLSLKY